MILFQRSSWFPTLKNYEQYPIDFNVCCRHVTWGPAVDRKEEGRQSLESLHVSVAKCLCRIEICLHPLSHDIDLCLREKKNIFRLKLEINKGMFVFRFYLKGDRQLEKKNENS